jgi:hypothetical protein
MLATTPASRGSGVQTLTLHCPMGEQWVNVEMGTFLISLSQLMI